MSTTPAAEPLSAEDIARVDALARELLVFARHRPGRMAAVSVRVPRGAAGTAAALADRLDDFGMDRVVVHVHYGEGPAQIVSVEFER